MATPLRWTLAAAAVIGALAAAGCGSGSAPAPMQRPVLVDDQVYTTSTMPASESDFDAPPAKVWAALHKAYPAVGIEITVDDPTGHRVGNTNFWKSGYLNGQPIAHFADCGFNMQGPRANNTRVYFSVLTTLTTLTARDAGHTRLATSVHPVSLDVAGGATDRLACGSTGALEQLLYAAVRRELGGS
ncbi:MAG TPA: hypothetical protein VNE60_12240 [Gemmatimonadaceae bacterium]|nr:hypothetical protein [Gemmatimonadaceae bacterium]